MLRRAGIGGGSFPSVEARMHDRASCNGATNLIGKLTQNFCFLTGLPSSSAFSSSLKYKVNKKCR